MEIKFYAYGHENITGKHKTTLEFTKDKSLTEKGDCIIGVNSDFDLDENKKFIDRVINECHEYKNKNKNKKIKNENNNYTKYKIKIIIKINNKNKNHRKEIIDCEINKNFNSDKDMVIRKSGFSDKRTFAVRADKAACDIDRNLVAYIKNPNSEIEVLITK